MGRLACAPCRKVRNSCILVCFQKSTDRHHSNSVRARTLNSTTSWCTTSVQNAHASSTMRTMCDSTRIRVRTGRIQRSAASAQAAGGRSSRCPPGGHFKFLIMSWKEDRDLWSVFSPSLSGHLLTVFWFGGRRSSKTSHHHPLNHLTLHPRTHVFITYVYWCVPHPY